jgi:hypothetical protein
VLKTCLWAACAAVVCCVVAWPAGAMAAGLPDGRGYEMVSPPDKAGGGVAVTVARTRAAADGSALAFLSLIPFGDAQGTGVETEYMAQRLGEPGTPGWSTHAITARQDPLTIVPLLNVGSPAFVDELSPDLDSGIFRAWSPLTDVPDVADVENLYVRRDLRTAGAGTWDLATDCPACAGTPLTTVPGTATEYPWAAGASTDFRQVLFESTLNLTGDGAGAVKLYVSDNGVVRLAGVVPGGSDSSCGGTDPACVPPSGDGSSVAGLSAFVMTSLPNVISDDGSRVNFSAPTNGGVVNLTASNMYQRDSHGTASTADDTTVRINATERTGGAQVDGASYQGASTDGSRIFFTSNGLLTDDAPAGVAHLYMWHQAPNDEVQQVTVAGSGGTFTLTFGGQTTSPLAANATAAQVKTALDALSSIGGAGGTVEVTGGPGDDTGTSPYLIRFARTLGGTNLALMTADGSALTGTTPAASVGPWVAGGGHLTLIDRDEEPADAPGNALGVIGTSQDGSYVYFIANSQLVAGEPPLSAGRDIYVWHNGTITFIGTLTFSGSAVFDWALNMPASDGAGQFAWADIPSRVSPDGKALLFAATSGSGLTGIDQTGCGTGGRSGCKELYVYQAESSRLACASCPTGGQRPTSDATSYAFVNLSGATSSAHQAHALSDDGRRVFFTTIDPLVPEDVNNRTDAYEYDTLTRTASLISTGRSTSDSYFVEASASGDDVFFETREQLVGWDVDNAVDIYDARVNGGFPEPIRPVQCDLSACHGPLNPAPPTANTGSSNFTGAGNLHQHIKHHTRAKRCKKGTVRRKSHGKTRCIKHRRARPRGR